MARTIKVVYENGVFRPLGPVYLDEGAEVELYLAFEPNLVTPEEYEKTLLELQEAAAELTDQEWEHTEADILGPGRMTVKKEKGK